MRRLTWFMRKHSEGRAHWDDEERPWIPFLLSDVRRDGTPFVFIIHHPSIVFQSMTGGRAVVICMLIISLATRSTDTWSALPSRRNPGSLRVWEFSYPFHNIHCWGDIFDYWWFGTKRFSAHTTDFWCHSARNLLCANEGLPTGMKEEDLNIS